MNYSLKTDSFNITLNIRVYEDDIQYPNNTIIDVMVESDCFSGKASMDIDIKEFAKFASNLYDLYVNLDGKARIKEPYGQMYLGFQGDGRGHICVNGLLHNVGQTLEFENMFDQTYFQEFSYALKMAYEKYLVK